MIKKVLQIWDVLKQVDKEDIQAIKDFVLLCKANGLSVVMAVRRVIAGFKELQSELED